MATSTPVRLERLATNRDSFVENFESLLDSMPDEQVEAFARSLGVRPSKLLEAAVDAEPKDQAQPLQEPLQEPVKKSPRPCDSDSHSSEGQRDRRNSEESRRNSRKKNRKKTVAFEDKKDGLRQVPGRSDAGRSDDRTKTVFMDMHRNSLPTEDALLSPDVLEGVHSLEATEDESIWGKARTVLTMTRMHRELRKEKRKGELSPERTQRTASKIIEDEYEVLDHAQDLVAPWASSEDCAEDSDVDMGRVESGDKPEPRLFEPFWALLESLGDVCCSRDSQHMHVLQNREFPQLHARDILRHEAQQRA